MEYFSKNSTSIFKMDYIQLEDRNMAETKENKCKRNLSYTTVLIGYALPAWDFQIKDYKVMLYWIKKINKLVTWNKIYLKKILFNNYVDGTVTALCNPLQKINFAKSLCVWLKLSLLGKYLRFVNWVEDHCKPLL